MSFFSQIMEPGGGVMLLPFVRMVICFLLVLTVTAAVLGVARIHMVILSVLSSGLLVSLSFFESEFNKLRSAREARTSSSSDGPKSAASNKAAKSD